MRISIVATVALAGCGFGSRGSTGADARPIDASDAPADGLDAPDTPPDAQACFGNSGWTICLQTLPTSPTSLAGGINTTNDARCLASQPASWSGAGQPDACIITGTTITIGTTVVSVTGNRPLVLVATDSMSIDTVLDVASHRNPAVIGPAAPSALCQAFMQAPGGSSNGAGGGAGASFMSIGGDGGKGDNNTNQNGTAPGADLSAPTLLRGGCNGQDGGDGVQVAGQNHGAGGGAVYLVAGNQITLGSTALINASGAGGTGGGHEAGGGGGGSAGSIVLFAPAITATTGAKLVANGGSGAAGSDNNTDGNDGNDPNAAAPTMQPNGGNGPGGDGGKGFAGGTDATPGVGGSGGPGSTAGGGGGGAAGFIRANIAISGATASPAITVVL